MKKLLPILLTIALFSSCRTLQAPTTSVVGQLDKYKYAYILPTSGITSSSGVYSTKYGVYGGSVKTMNPADAISGYLMKQGFTVLPNLEEKYKDQTIVVSFGYVGKRNLFLAYTIIVLIQLRDAQTQELIASSEAEGCGETEVEDYLQAINRALDDIFHKYQISKEPKTSECLPISTQEVKN